MKTEQEKLVIVGFHCQAMKNQNQTRPIDIVKILANERK